MFGVDFSDDVHVQLTSMSVFTLVLFFDFLD